MWAPWISDALQAADVTLTGAAVGDGDADLELRLPFADGPVTARFKVKKWEIVKPSTVDQLPRLYPGDVPLLVIADRMSAESVDRLREGGYSWLSRKPLASGLRGELRTTHAMYEVQSVEMRNTPPSSAGPGRPARAAGRLAQSLFYLGAATQKMLVDETGLSQARISQLLSEWPAHSGLIRVGSRPFRWQIDDPDRFISAWLTRYVPGERITSYWYGLDSLPEQARSALSALKNPGLVSGELAADALAPWALPRRVLLYTDEGHDLSTVGFVPSPRDGATLELVSTRDPAIKPSNRAQHFLSAAMQSTTWPLADPLVVLFDLTRSDSIDADQAAQRLQTRLVDIWRSEHRRG